MITCSVATFATAVGGTAQVAVTCHPVTGETVMALVVTPVPQARSLVMDEGDGWFRVDRITDPGQPVLIGTGPVADGTGPEEFAAEHGYSLLSSAAWDDTTATTYAPRG